MWQKRLQMRTELNLGTAAAYPDEVGFNRSASQTVQYYYQCSARDRRPRKTHA